MAKLEAYGKTLRDSLKVNRVKLAGLGITATVLVSKVAAAEEDFSFINDTLQGIGSAILGVLPLAGSIVSAGGPVVVKTAVYVCVAAPFVAVAGWLLKHT